MANVKPYATHRDSTLQWLGTVPSHWTVGRVKQGYDIQLGKMLQTKPNAEDDVEVPYLKAKHVQWFNVRTDGSTRMWASPKAIAHFGVYRGDLLVCEGGEGGRCGILRCDAGDHIIQNSLHRVRPRSGNSNGFLQYTMRTVAETGWLETLNNKATIAHFTREKFAALSIPFPTRSEQEAIVRFLDYADQRIRRYIRAKEKLISLLEEQKQAIIHQAITGQIDVRTGGQYSAYRDSEVEWLEEVPEHWCELPLKRVARIDNSGGYGEDPDHGQVVLPVATTAQIDYTGRFSVEAMPRRGFSWADADRYRCLPNDILVVKSSGSIFNVVSGKAGIVDAELPEFAFSNFLLRVVAFDRVMDSQFLYSVLSGYLTRERVKRMVVGSTYPNLKVHEYSSALLPIPPISEQAAIVSFLKDATQTVGAAIDNSHSHIKLLREYRIRLIADVVTGKLDVREAAESLPELAPLRSIRARARRLEPQAGGAMDPEELNFRSPKNQFTHDHRP